MATIRLSPAQRNLAHIIEKNVFLPVSYFKSTEIKTLDSLERKGLIKKLVDDEGQEYWVHKIFCAEHTTMRWLITMHS